MERPSVGRPVRATELEYDAILVGDVVQPLEREVEHMHGQALLSVTAQISILTKMEENRGSRQSLGQRRTHMSTLHAVTVPFVNKYI